jgi:hypothetical protein
MKSRMRWGGHVAKMGKMKNVLKILVKEPEGKRLPDWIHLTQDRDQWQALVNTVMNLRVS